MIRPVAIILYCVLLSSSCIPVANRGAKAHGKANYTPSKTVTRNQILNNAYHYVRTQWKPTEANKFHGKDKSGISVNTPDSTHNPKARRNRGWWVPNKLNTGVPYMWGGFDTPETFKQKVKQGYYAGDAYTSEKRRQLWDGVSKYAAGVDCSGFVSRCLRLPKHYSTREIPALCSRVSSFKQLKPGDIINKHNTHVMFFVRHVKDDPNGIIVIQSGTPPTSKTIMNRESIAYLKNHNYKLLRYKGTID